MKPISVSVLSAIVAIAAIVGGAVKWGKRGYNVYKARGTKRKDAKVLAALANRDLWKNPRPMTGAGDLCVRAGEIADVLALTAEGVSDSLERLEAEGKVLKHDGTLSNPAPYWTVVRRW